MRDVGSEAGTARTVSQEEGVNAFDQMLEFIFALQRENIHFTLKCQREAIMVVVPSPSSYFEVEFFSEGHIEVQEFGRAGGVYRATFESITGKVIDSVNGSDEKAN